MVATAVALPAVVLLGRLLASQLYGVATYDPVALGASVGLAAATVVVASVLPARRPASVEPVLALRVE